MLLFRVVNVVGNDGLCFWAIDFGFHDGWRQSSSSNDFIKSTVDTSSRCYMRSDYRYVALDLAPYPRFGIPHHLGRWISFWPRRVFTVEGTKDVKDEEDPIMLMGNFCVS